MRRCALIEELKRDIKIVRLKFGNQGFIEFLHISKKTVIITHYMNIFKE